MPSKGYPYTHAVFRCPKGIILRTRPQHTKYVYIFSLPSRYFGLIFAAKLIVMYPQKTGKAKIITAKKTILFIP
jgi:hypothetical protein